MDGVDQVPSRRTISLQGASGVNQEENCGTDLAVAVGPGAHTVAFVASPAAATTTFDEATLEVLFVPFDGNGAAPAKSTVDKR